MNVIAIQDSWQEAMMASAAKGRAAVIERDGGPIAYGGKPGKSPSLQTIAMLKFVAENGPVATNAIAEHFGEDRKMTRAKLVNFVGTNVVRVVGRQEMIGRGGRYKVAVWQIGPGYDAWAKAEAARNG